MIITPQGHEIELLPDHAIYLPQHSALVLSDVHLGKAATFRAHGLAVPDGDNARDLKRINKLLDSTRAEQLIIAGDLFHAPTGNCPELDEWLAACPAEVTLVIGNHDQRSLPKNFPAKISSAIQLGELEIIHDPAEASEKYFSICGHLHPVIRIRDSKRTFVRSACFHLSENTLTLPSFGTFTGGQLIQPKSPERIFIPLNGRVAEIPTTSCC